MKNDIIIFGMNKFDDWKNNTNFNRSYYILQEMLKREDINRILYIDYLPVKRVRALLNTKSIIKNLFSQVIYKTPYSYCVQIKKDKLYEYATILSVINWNSVYKELNKLVNKLKFENIILWSYYPLNVDYFDYLKNDMTVVYLDDDWQQKKSMQNGSKIDYIDVLRKNYNAISNKANFIFTSSDELLEIFMGHDNSFWIDDVSKKDIKDYNWKQLVDEMFIKFK
ncbi:MAG: hypothetical protein Q8P20_02300 [bacterium]|nr:hypothetical protein [bacterium]